MKNKFHHTHLLQIIEKYLSGRATKKEKDFLESYYDYFEKEPAILDTLTPTEKMKLKNRMQQHILAQIEKKQRPMIPLWKKAGRIAAIVAVFISLALLTREYIFLPEQTAEIEAVVEIKTTAKEGKPLNLYLADGSIVILNGGSSLTYKSAFPDSIREVHLLGEAYFDISHNPAKPFIVHSGKVRTRVLGTAFNVKAYPGQEEILVRVIRGKVRVDAPEEEKLHLDENAQSATGNLSIKKQSESITLTPDEQIAYNTTTGDFSYSKMKAAPIVTSWKPAEYTMDNLNMAQATRIIATRFGKKIEFENPKLKNKRITASFFEEDPLEELLTVICGVSKCSYSIRGNTIIIKDKENNPEEKSN